MGANPLKRKQQQQQQQKKNEINQQKKLEQKNNKKARPNRWFLQTFSRAFSQCICAGTMEIVVFFHIFIVLLSNQVCGKSAQKTRYRSMIALRYHPPIPSLPLLLVRHCYRQRLAGYPLPLFTSPKRKISNL